MFIAGAAFCYYAVLPAGLSFLANYMDGAVTQSWRQATYAAFVIQFLLAFGVIFELPVAVFLLAKLGLVTARGMWGFTRYAVVIIFVVAAFLTPGPDPVSQLLMALPLIALYILSIGVCVVAGRKTA
jgi:sec-independent protein translocase protein TatC